MSYRLAYAVTACLRGCLYSGKTPVHGFEAPVYRPLDVTALASSVLLKVAKVAERLRRLYDVALACDGALTGSPGQLCLSRESGARNVDAFLNQRILPAVSLELLARMAGGRIPAEIRLSISAEESLVIYFMDRHGAR